MAAAAAAHNAAAVVAYNAAKGQEAGHAAAARRQNVVQDASRANVSSPTIQAVAAAASGEHAAAGAGASMSRHARRRQKKHAAKAAAALLHSEAAAVAAAGRGPGGGCCGAVSEEQKLKKARTLSSLGGRKRWDVVWHARNASLISTTSLPCSAHPPPPVVPARRIAVDLLLVGQDARGGRVAAGGGRIPAEPAGRGASPRRPGVLANTLFLLPVSCIRLSNFVLLADWFAGWALPLAATHAACILGLCAWQPATHRCFSRCPHTAWTDANA